MTAALASATAPHNKPLRVENVGGVADAAGGKNWDRSGGCVAAISIIACALIGIVNVPGGNVKSVVL